MKKVFEIDVVMLMNFYKLGASIILGVIYFGIVTPIALLLRVIGCDVVSSRLSGMKKTYWIERTQSQMALKNFPTQFISKSKWL